MMSKKTKIVCPHCNRIILVHLNVSKPWGVARKLVKPRDPPRGQMQSTKKTIFENESLADLSRANVPTYGMPGGPTPAQMSGMIDDFPANFEARRSSLDMEPNLANQVVLPLVESFVFGAFVGLMVLIVIVVIDTFSPNYSVTWGALLGISGMFGAVAAFYRYLSASDFYKDIIQKVEEVTKRDINHDGFVGAPNKGPSLSVQVDGPGPGLTRQFADLPGDLFALRNFARMMAMGKVTFSELGAQQSKYGQKNFIKLRDIFLNRDWARWKNPEAHTEGAELRHSGKRILEALANTGDDTLAAEEMEEDTQYGRFAHIDY